MCSSATTAQLLTRIHESSRPDRLIADLAHRFQPAMTGYARRRGLHDLSAARQAIHLAVWKAAGRFDAERSNANADALVWNLFKNELRGMLRESTWRFGCEPMSAATSRSASCTDCFDEFEAMVAFAQQIEELDSRNRTVAVLVTGIDRGEPRTQRELAAELNVSVGTANARLHELRDAFAVAA